MLPLTPVQDKLPSLQLLQLSSNACTCQEPDEEISCSIALTFFLRHCKSAEICSRSQELHPDYAPSVKQNAKAAAVRDKEEIIAPGCTIIGAW